MTISNNSYPLNVLSTLGITVKPEEGKPHLPKELGEYLDQIIESGDLESLYNVSTQVMSSVEGIAMDNPRSALNAILAMNRSEDAAGQQVGLATCAGEEGKKQADPRLFKYHDQQKQLYARIANAVGINNNGLFLEVTDRKQFNEFLKSLSESKIELTDKDKNFFNTLVKDDLFILSGKLHREDEIKNMTKEELDDHAATYMTLRYQLGIEHLIDESGKEHKMHRYGSGLRSIAKGDQTFIPLLRNIIDAINFNADIDV